METIDACWTLKGDTVFICDTDPDIFVEGEVTNIRHHWYVEGSPKPGVLITIDDTDYFLDPFQRIQLVRPRPRVSEPINYPKPHPPGCR